MTIRDFLSSKKRKVMIAFILGFILFGGAGMLRDRYHIPIFSIISALGFVLSFGSLLYLKFALRCPQCRKSLASVSSGGGLLSFPKQAQYCPFCGLDLDSPHDSTSSA